MAPELAKTNTDAWARPGDVLHHAFDEETFIDKDPGDVLSFSAQLATGEPLPPWVTFDAHSRTFR